MSKHIFNNTKLMFAKYLPVVDGEGKVIDSVLIEANETFRDFFRIKNPVGQLRSVILPVSNIGMNQYMQQLMIDPSQISWEYFEEGLGNIQVFMDSSDGGRTINVITTDIFSKKAENSLEEKEHEENMIAMDLFGIAIWHVDICNREMYSKSPVSASNIENYKRFDEATQCFVWDLDERFSFIPDHERTFLYSEIDKLVNGEKTKIHMNFEVTSPDGDLVNVEMIGVVESRDRVTGKPCFLTAYMRMKKA